MVDNRIKIALKAIYNRLLPDDTLSKAYLMKPPFTNKGKLSRHYPNISLG
jgi:hypothetical protein